MVHLCYKELTAPKGNLWQKMFTFARYFNLQILIQQQKY
jgi:hypothetical protein